MKEGMEKLAQYQNALNCPRNGILRVEPDKSGGPKEIWTQLWKLAELIICPNKYRFLEERGQEPTLNLFLPFSFSIIIK
jgi:hypothetical protein